MEETTKSPNGHGGGKKMVVKVGGGGIGAVVLLAGALATAALASAFAVRRKSRSSGEDSSNEKREDNVMREGGEEVGLENDSTVVISDPSTKLDDKAKCETDAENDPVSEDGFIIVKEEIPLLAEKFKVEFKTQDASIEESNEGDEEYVEVNDVEPREEEKSEECPDQTVQTQELEGFANGEINEEKCVEKTILPQFEVERDEEVGEEEEVPLPSEGVEMIGDDDDDDEKAEEKSVEEEKKLMEIEIGGEEKGGKLSSENRGKNGSMQCEVGNGEEKVEGGGLEESKWEGVWKSAESKVIKYEVGGKIEEDRVVEQKMKIKDDSSTRRSVMIWMVCVVSSLSCSWFLDLSFVKLALFLFLTVFLLEIYGFSLFNHRHQHYHVLQKEVLSTSNDHKRGSNKLGNI